MPLVKIGSIRQAAVTTGVTQAPGDPRAVREVAKPTPHVEEKVTCAVGIVRTEPTADASFAAMRARSKFGIAMAAMIKMIATTISNSISEKPFWFFFILSFSLELVFLISLVLPGGVRPGKSKGRAKSEHVFAFATHASHLTDIPRDTLPVRSCIHIIDA